MPILKRLNKPYLKARLGYTKTFWKTRYSLLKLNLRRLRSLFTIRLNADTAHDERSAFRTLTKWTFVPILLAVLAAASLYIVERNIGTITAWPLIENSWLDTYLHSGINQDAYVQLLVAVAGVTGVFLALYFTAVSTVAANAYTTVPQDIRELLIKDRLGNVYVKSVSFLTALSVLLISLCVTGVNPLHLATPLVALLSCFAVFAFLRLGQRAFFLADPTLLSHTLSSELLKWAERSGLRKWYWRDINFQQHYRTQGSKSVSTLDALAKLSSKKTELQGDSFPSLVRRMIYTLRLYLTLKPKIPSNSQWFGKRYQHKQWYLSESTDIETATQTDTALRPNEVPDTNWVEDALVHTIVEALKERADNDDYEALYSLLFNTQDLFNDVGGQWLIEEGKTWVGKLRETIIKRLIDNKEAIAKPNSAYSLAVMDICASLPLSVELGFIKTINDLDINVLRKDLSKADWTKPGSVYKFSKLPPNTIKTLEQIHQSAIFEMNTNAKHKAPGWYVVEVAFNNLDWSMFKNWTQLLGFIESWYFSVAEELAEAGLYTHAAAIYDRALELSWKLDSHIERLKETSESLRDDLMLDFKRPEWDWDDYTKRAETFRSKTVDAMAELIPRLMSEPPDSDVPDYFGHAVHVVGRECFMALDKNDVDRFKKLFVPYFVGTLGTFDKVRPQVAEWELATAITWIGEPLIDLFDISGYAYIYAEFHQNAELWETCKLIWDHWLSGEGAEDRLKLLAGLSYNYQTLLGTITPRDPLRAGWEMWLGRLLRDLPRRENKRRHPFTDPPVDHSSSFIRAIAPHQEIFMFTKAIDVFIVKYLMARPGAPDVDFGVAEGRIEHINRDQENEDE